AAVDALRTFCGWTARHMTRRPALFSLLSLLLVGGLAMIYANLEPRYRLADQTPDREQATRASERLDEKLTGANPVHVMIRLPAGRNLYDEESLAVIAEAHKTVEVVAGLGNVWSIETLRQWLKEKTGQADADTLRRYVELLPEHLTRR